MKLKDKISGYIIRSAAIAVLFSCAIVGFSSAFVSPGNDSKLRRPSQSVLRGSGQTKTVTFADRVLYQRAIEEIYWRHRIWPSERPDPKPPLDAVMSQAELEKKVEDYLRDSQALEDYWQRPITHDQLQAEMERMAQHTKQPQVLRELFQALGDDPFVIAECLARPVLAQRLVTELNDNNRVSVTKIAWLTTTLHPKKVAAIDSMAEAVQARHAVAERSWVNRLYQLPTISSPAGACIDDTWTTASATSAPDGRVDHTAVWTGSEMIIWGGIANGSVFDTGGRYNPSTDSWTATSTTNAPTARDLHTAVWTGSEMIVWGGRGSGPTPLNTGGRYNPATDSWTVMTANNAPDARFNHTAVWTDSEMIVWGGFNGSNLNTGGRYNPGTDSWTATSISGVPVARTFHTAVWTGSEMIVWGGLAGGSTYLNTGGRYDPSTDGWTATSTTNAPAGRYSHTAVLDNGSEMIVWGGNNGSYLSTGGRYDPGTDSWTATSTTGAPAARLYHTAVWIGIQMIVWGGQNATQQFNTGGKYNPSTDSWTATSLVNAPSARTQHTAVWTASEMIVWGGSAPGPTYFNTGGRYCAQSGATPTPTPTSTPTATATPTATSTPTATPRITPTPRSRPTPAPRPSP